MMQVKECTSRERRLAGSFAGSKLIHGWFTRTRRVRRLALQLALDDRAHFVPPGQLCQVGQAGGTAGLGEKCEPLHNAILRRRGNACLDLGSLSSGD